jgi:hypothetical protein
VLSEDTDTVRVVLHLSDTAHPGTLKAEIETADTREQGHEPHLSTTLPDSGGFGNPAW